MEFHIRKCLPDVSDIAVDLVSPADDPQSSLLVVFASFNRDQRSMGGRNARTIFTEPLSPDVSIKAWNHLESSLPGYMVPSIIFPISQMPLSTTGKKDMRALLTLADRLQKDEMMVYSCAKKEIRPPTTRQEELIRRAWADVLKLSLDSIGINDSFIRLGGDSIRAMRLVAVCRREGLTFTVVDVFRYPRLCDLALIAENCQSEAEEADTALEPFALMEGRRKFEDLLPGIMSQSKIDCDQIEDVYPCTPLQEGMMALSLRRPGAYMVRFEIELSFDLVQNLEPLRLAWEKVVEANPILRTRIIHTDQDGFLQVVVREPAHWRVKESRCECHDDTQDSFMTVGSRLSQYALEVSAEGEDKTHKFNWTMHHSIYDARSMQSILEQVEAAYLALVSDSSPGDHHIKPRCRPAKFNSYVQEMLNCNLDESDRFWSAQISNGKPKTFPVVAPI